MTQRGGTAVPPLWKPLPELDGGAAAEREAGGVLFAARCVPCPQMRGRSSLNGTGIAQPVGAFQVWSEVRDGQPPVLGDLTPSCQIIPQRFFFCTVSGTEGEWPRRGKRSPSGGFSFWQDKKKMWGTFCTAKPCLPVPHSGTSCGGTPHILGPPFQGEPFKGA